MPLYTLQALNAYSAIGWRDLDDIVEYGWTQLSRVQQIGVKYYEELLLKIPRTEVEEIGRIILRHARKIEPRYRGWLPTWKAAQRRRRRDSQPFRRSHDPRLHREAYPQPREERLRDAHPDHLP
jgi:Fingers domain of DNA polymerase lambda